MITLSTTTIRFQKTLQSLLQAIEASIELSQEKKEMLYERIYHQLRKVTEAVLVVHMPEKKLKELGDHPDSINLSAYADLIATTMRDPQTCIEIEGALTGVIEKITSAIKPKL